MVVCCAEVFGGVGGVRNCGAAHGGDRADGIVLALTFPRVRPPDPGRADPDNGIRDSNNNAQVYN